MPLRNSEQPIPLREPHQGLSAPTVHTSLMDLGIAYVNLLEERIYVFDLELSAMRERYGHQIWGKEEANMPEVEQATPEAGALLMLIDQMEAVRAKNTELEAKLIHTNADWQVQLDTSFARQHELARQLDVANEKIANLIRATPWPNAVNEWATQAMMWCRDTFGGPVAVNNRERAARLIEEAIEVGQSVGVEITMVENIARMVYSKPPGDLAQELGGVIVCWGVMCAATGNMPSRVMDNALADCWARQDVIRAKLATKIKMGASPSVLAPDGERTVPRYVDDDDAHKTKRMAHGMAHGIGQGIDGATAIKAGSDNLKHFVESTRQPGRGE